MEASASALAVLSIATIIGAPILSNYGFRFGFIENILARIFLVGIIIYAIQKDTLVGLITFLAVFTLLLERNHALAIDLPNQRTNIVNSGSVNSGSVNSGSVKAAPVAESNVALRSEISDNIPRLEQAPSSSSAVAFFRQIG
jgi:hypothetical protein